MTDMETEGGEPTKGSAERVGKREKSKSRDLSNRSLKTDGEKDSGEPR